MAAGALGVGAVLALCCAPGHDQLWVLYAAGRMLQGVRLYGPQIFESNPPLIFWLSEMPVALARFLHVESSVAAKLVTLVAILSVYGVSLLCLKRTWRPARLSELAPWLAFYFAVAFLCVPARDFGQREHLLSFLVLPYLVLAAAKVDKDQLTIRVLAGVLAAVGICLKPQQALLPVAVEAALLLEQRSLRPLRRPEPWLLLLLCTAYVGVMRLLTPEYFTETLPVLRETYWAIGHLSLASLLTESWQLQTLACCAIALAWSRVVRYAIVGSVGRLYAVLLAAGIGSDLAYLQQGTGWYYQQVPSLCFFVAALMLSAAAWIWQRNWQPPQQLRRPAAALAVVATLLTLCASGYPVTRERAYALADTTLPILATLPQGTPVAILTTSVDEAMLPVARYHLFWAQRTNNLWWMPAILRSEQPALARGRALPTPRLQALEGLQRHNMAEDLTRWKPALVLIERCQDPAVRCQVIEDLSPDLLTWFAQDGGFRQAFAPYRLQATDGRFDVYRRDSPATER